jgi:hypothetical protein
MFFIEFLLRFSQENFLFLPRFTQENFQYLLLVVVGSIIIVFFVVVALTVIYFIKKVYDVVTARAVDTPVDIDIRLDESKATHRLSPLRVFICYSPQNKIEAKKLYEDLRRNNCNPWLDEEKILPGHYKDLEISNALNNSDIVLVLLSKQSVGQSGHMQKEIRVALEISETHPDGKVFIIPVRLDECEVPVSLSKWQWANLFETNGYQRLQKSLDLRFPRA